MLKIDVWVIAKHKSFYHGLNQNFDGTILGLQRDRDRETDRDRDRGREKTLILFDIDNYFPANLN